MLNKAILVGRLTKEPELKSTQSGKSVISFTVAIPRKFTDANGERQSDFINCVAFGKTAEFVEKHFNKGDIISIDGTIQVRVWEDNEGKKHYATEVMCEAVGFVGGKRKEEQKTEALPQLPQEFSADGDDENLPF
jgi:single-strand DNA-binding protein